MEDADLHCRTALPWPEDAPVFDGEAAAEGIADVECKIVGELICGGVALASDREENAHDDQR